MMQTLGMGSLFEDPISLEMMEDAVITYCGHSFSDSTITDWFDVKKRTCCPLCLKDLNKNQIIPNYKLREAISFFKRLQQQHAQDLKSLLILGSNPTTVCPKPEELSRSPDTHIGTPITDILDSLSSCSDDEEVSIPSNAHGHLDHPKLLIDIQYSSDEFWGLKKAYVTSEILGDKKSSKTIKDTHFLDSFVYNVLPNMEKEGITLQLWEQDKLIGSSHLATMKLQINEIISQKRIIREFVTKKSKGGKILLKFLYLESPVPKKRLTFDTSSELSRDLRAEIADLRLQSPPPEISLPEKPVEKLTIRLPGLCRWWAQGNCLHGDQCPNLHEKRENVVPREELVKILVEMGFEKEVVMYTLKRCKNHLPTATNLLLTESFKLKQECIVNL